MVGWVLCGWHALAHPVPASNLKTPSRRRETRHSTYARPTPPTAQHGPPQRVFGVHVDVQDRRRRCNSEKHPRLRQLFDARSHDPSIILLFKVSLGKQGMVLLRSGRPAGLGLPRTGRWPVYQGVDPGLEAFRFRPSLTSFGDFSRPRRRE